MPEVKRPVKTGFEYLDHIRKVQKDGRKAVEHKKINKKHTIKRV